MCRDNNVNYYKYSNISDDELDEMVRQFLESKPNSGLRYLIGHIRSRGFRIQKQRVRDSVSRVDPLSRAVRTYQAIPRGRYEVPRANSLWHVDGHHKLILWGFVIHGFVDGRTRAVSTVECSLFKNANSAIL